MNLSSLVALDPASPWFEQTREEHRVSKTDAEFVDVIHTNSGLLVTVISMYITFITYKITRIFFYSP